MRGRQQVAERRGVLDGRQATLLIANNGRRPATRGAEFGKPRGAGGKPALPLAAVGGKDDTPGPKASRQLGREGPESGRSRIAGEHHVAGSLEGEFKGAE